MNKTVPRHPRLNAFVLIPFLYFATTRLTNIRAIVYLVASSWVPAIWLAYRLASTSPIETVFLFAAGYLSFIAIYEIGYLANDLWDAARSPSGRRRVQSSLGAVQIIVFVLIRLATWAAVGIWFGWIANPIWLASYAALAVVYAGHNLLSSNDSRGSTFYQLATFRFICPILPIVSRSDTIILVVAALMFYTYLRHLSYLDSKGLLLMEQRSGAGFSLTQTLIFAPFVAFASYAMSWPVLVELYLYFLASYLIWFHWSRQSVRTRSGEQSRTDQ